MSYFADTDAQIALFAGCSYDLAKNRIMLPDGILCTRSSFDILFGGYTFTMDTANEKTTKSAWKAFTQNQAYRPPMVHGGSIVKVECCFAHPVAIKALFDGLVYDFAKGKIMLPDGRLVDRSRFDILFGGITFSMDVANERTSRSAWKAFTQNQAYRPVVVFR